MIPTNYTTALLQLINSSSSLNKENHDLEGVGISDFN